MSKKYLLSLLCCLAMFAGCRNHGMLAKRESEQNCPTDIRKTVPWCAGEDAVFRCPCGPNEQFHGHKPTCWVSWQTSGAVWRDMHCQPACSKFAAEVPVGILVEQFSEPTEYSQSVEAIVPTEAIPPIEISPALPLPDNGSPEEVPVQVTPALDSEPLPATEVTPQQQKVPEDATSSSMRLQQPRQKKANRARSRSLTNYFHQLEKAEDKVMQRRRVPSEHSQQFGAKQLMLFPPPEIIKEKVAKEAVSHVKTNMSKSSIELVKPPVVHAAPQRFTRRSLFEGPRNSAPLFVR